MAKEIGRYDTEVQMFVETPRPVSLNHLKFQRWLAENRPYEHPVESRPHGDFYASAILQGKMKPYPDNWAAYPKPRYDLNYEHVDPK